jgi:hypothetical protein
VPPDILSRPRWRRAVSGGSGLARRSAASPPVDAAAAARQVAALQHECWMSGWPQLDDELARWRERGAPPNCTGGATDDAVDTGPGELRSSTLTLHRETAMPLALRSCRAREQRPGRNVSLPNLGRRFCFSTATPTSIMPRRGERKKEELGRTARP